MNNIEEMNQCMRHYCAAEKCESALLPGGIILTFAYSKKDFPYAMGIG